MTGARALLCSTGRISSRSTPAPKMNDSTTAMAMATHTGRPRTAWATPVPTVRAKMMNVENIAISPWAKFRCPVVL